MANFQERFGRKGKDAPSLLEEIPILGRRIIENPSKDMLPPHTLKYFQLIFVEHGEVEVWVNNRFYTVRDKEMIVIKPYETMAYINGLLPRGKRSFLQIDFNPIKRSIDQSIMDSLYKHLNFPGSRILRAGNFFLEPHTSLLDELRNTGYWSHNYLKSNCEILFINLIRLYEKEISILEDDNSLLALIESYIVDNINDEISVFDLAKLSGLSENYFRVQFKKITGMSPLKYINSKRIDFAKEKLLNSQLSITEVAFDLGFSSCQYFSTFFKKQTSLTPEEFRKTSLEMLTNTVKKSVIAKDAAAQLDTFF